jgi:hypothetical protein
MAFTNGLVLFGNIFPLHSVLNVTGYDADHPDTELNSKNPKHFCKAGAVGTQNIKVDMGATWNKAVKGACLFNVNLSSGDTFNFQGNATDVWTAPSGDQLMTLKERTIEIEGEEYKNKAIFASGLSWSAYRYLRYNLAISGTEVEGAVPFIFKDQYEFGINYEWGYKGGQETAFIETPAGEGMEYSELEYTRYKATIAFKGISDSQIEEIDRKIKQNAYVVFLPEGPGGDIFLGRFRFNLPGHKYFEDWNIGGTFTELPAYRKVS